LKSALFNLNTILTKIESAKHLLLFLDYDGTLTPIVNRPDKALLSQDNRQLLKSLTKNEKIIISIVTGRDLKKIKRLIRIKDIYYAGCHGLEISSKTKDYVLPQVRKTLSILSKIKHALKKELKDIKSAQIEDKGLILALHYRRVHKSQILKVRKIFYDYLKPYIDSKKVKVGKGKKVLEVRPPLDRDKGMYCLHLLDSLKKRYKNILPLYIGDDDTDETAFRALKKKGITIFVKGEKKTSSAEYYLGSTEEVSGFLKKLL